MSKKEQRISALAARRALSAQQRAEYSRSICAKLAALPCFEAAQCVLSYMATPDEVDLSALHDVCRAMGKRLAFPLCGDNGAMDAYIPGAFVSGKYGLTEPDKARSVLTVPEDFDLVIVPCVGFDGEKRRIGHGAGYYDRYLPRCSRARFVSPAFEAQRLPHVETDKFDTAMDIIVTEEEIIL